MAVNSDTVIISLEEVMTDYKGKLSALAAQQKTKTEYSGNLAGENRSKKQENSAFLSR